MLTTSSPTLSAPSSPSGPFHPPPRTYHASRRPSQSSLAQSPRFYAQVSGSTSRRLDAPSATSSTPSAPVTSPSLSFSRSSPQLRKREYSDSGTQYTPPGYPPTYQSSSPTSTTSKPRAHAREAERTPQTKRTPAKRRETSAEPTVTEPPEPDLRVDPQTVLTTSGVPRTTATANSGETQRSGQNEAAKEEVGNNAIAQQPSASKRARPHDPSVKVMPLKYEMCDVKDLGVLISDMLMELVRLNDSIPLRDGQLTRFHSRAPPGISVRDYLFRLIVHATLPPPILLSMVYYVDRLCALYPAFTISSLTVHRFLITAATVAAKGLSDSFWTNSLYARVGGVSVRELALLELEFLRRLEWRIVPKPEVLVDYYKGLVERGQGYIMEKEVESVQETSPDIQGSRAWESRRSSVSIMDTDQPASGGTPSAA